MRVVLIHRYFAPDTPPYAHILRDIALRLGEAGHRVTVLTCQPSYNRAVVSTAPAREQLAPNVDVHRWAVLPDRRITALKLINMVLFCARLLLARRWLRDVDVVMAASTPPIAVAKVGSWLARSCGAQFVYHKQDIYPEVVTAPGILADGRRAALLRRVDTRTERAAARVVVLSDDMKATIADRGIPAEKIAVINNFDPWALADDRTRDGEASRDSQVMRVVFAGNLGRFQNLETVLNAIRLLADEPRVEFHFFGAGPLADEIARAVSAGVRTIHAHGYRPPNEVADFLRNEADLGIVSLVPGVVRAAYPSKTMSYLRQGCPVLALVESDSALARTLIESGAGYYADPTDPHDAARVIAKLADDPAALSEAGKCAARLYHRSFAPQRQLTLWDTLFSELAVRAA